MPISRAQAHENRYRKNPDGSYVGWPSDAWLKRASIADIDELIGYPPARHGNALGIARGDYPRPSRFGLDASPSSAAVRVAEGFAPREDRRDNGEHLSREDGMVAPRRPLDIAPASFVRWPWRALDGLTGGMAPGTCHYVVAYSGGGKSTFLRSAIWRWASQGVSLDVLPLEEPPEIFKAQLAAHACGVDCGPLLAGEEMVAELATVRAKLKELEDTVFDKTVRVDGAEGLTLARLEAACERAAERGSKLVIVDHVDHLSSSGRSLYEESVAVNRGALRLAQRYGLVLLLASQANSEALKGNRDHLAKYAPLRDNMVLNGGHKRTIASSMLSIFRPIRGKEIGESEEMYASALKRARSGDADPQTVLAQGQVGLSLMKSRPYGNREGGRVLLRWGNGSVLDWEQE